MENLLNVRSKNHGHKPVKVPLWSKFWLQESLKSQHKLCSITSQIAIQQTWNREQWTWQIHKLQLPDAAYMSLFQWRLNNPNGPTEEPRGMNLLTKCQPDPNSSSNPKIPVLKRNAENVVLVWDEFLSAQTTSAGFEWSDWSHTKYEPIDKISARSNSEQSIGGGWKLLSETFSLFNLFSLFSLTVCFCWRLSYVWKTLKVNIGLGLHIGSEPNPTLNSCTLQNNEGE